MVKLLEKAGYNTEKLMITLAHPCDRMITDCYWNDEQTNCSQIFNLTKTNYGFCCSFNYKRFSEKEEDELFVGGVGPSFGLYAQIHPEPEEYFSPDYHYPGIDISVHESFEYPDMSIYSATVRPGHDVSLNIKPQITESEESVKSTPIESRGCVFPEELNINKWAVKYTYASCIHRCKARAIIRLCGCVPYYYISGKTRKPRRRFCTLLDMPCIIRNYYKFQNATFYNINEATDNFKDFKNYKCDIQCHPQCNIVSYSFQVDQEQLEEANENGVRKPVDFVIMRVYFGQISCTKLLRSVFLTWEFILASVGGIIGLSLGGSILSIIEFFYHVFETLFSKYSTNKSNENVQRKINKQKTVEKSQIFVSDFKSLQRGKPTLSLK